MRPLPPSALALAVLLACGCATPRDDSFLEKVEGHVPRNRGPGARLDAPAPRPERPEEAAPPEDRRITFFPKGPLLYDPYIAAPRQSRSAVKLQFPVGDGRNVKVENTLGFARSLARWTSLEEPQKAREIEFEAAVFARFDLHEQYDFDASDWRFGIPFAWRDGDFAWKIHLYHMTSHLGDEFMDRTGAEPIAYHLEEASFGLSWDASAGSRVYGEAAAAIYTGAPTESGRFQAGWEWAGRKWTSGFSPYLAVDVQSRKEQDWTPGKTLAVGLAYGRDIRFGLEFFDGKDPQTQFLKERVRYLSVGVSMDL